MYHNVILGQIIIILDLHNDCQRAATQSCGELFYSSQRITTTIQAGAPV